MANNRTFEAAAEVLLLRFDRASNRLRNTLVNPFTSCEGGKAVEEAHGQLLAVVHDLAALRNVEETDNRLAKNVPPPAPAVPPTLNTTELGIIPEREDGSRV